MKQFTKILLSFSILLAFNVTTSSIRVNANDNDYNNDIEQIYQHGKDEGIINDNNMSYNQFNSLMKSSVIPVYENNKNNTPNFNKSLDEFTSDDNYEVAPGQNNDIEADVNGNDSDDSDMSMFKIKASKSYKMEPGDILICYGSNSLGGMMIGHAAIAKSSSEILEMPGPNNGAEKTSKQDFFQNRASKAKNGKYVAVYRMNNKKYANDAANYAYNNMYLNDTNPKYLFNPSLKDKMHSYCSKYVLLAYLNSNSKSVSNTAFIQNYGGFVHPHLLQDAFNLKKN